MFGNTGFRILRKELGFSTLARSPSQASAIWVTPGVNHSLCRVSESSEGNDAERVPPGRAPAQISCADLSALDRHHIRIVVRPESR